jgi:hypothetical protein
VKTKRWTFLLDQTTWMKFECPGGSRYTSTTEDDHGKPCTFSGCSCNGTVRKRGTTTDRAEAASWFRRPECDPQP